MKCPFNARKPINDKLQGSVATYLRCGEVVNNQIKKGLLLSLSVNFFSKSVNISQSYKQKRGLVAVNSITNSSVLTTQGYDHVYSEKTKASVWCWELTEH